jgi:hypothetical protein
MPAFPTHGLKGVLLGAESRSSGGLIKSVHIRVVEVIFDPHKVQLPINRRLVWVKGFFEEPIDGIGSVSYFIPRPGYFSSFLFHGPSILTAIWQELPQ